MGLASSTATRGTVGKLAYKNTKNQKIKKINNNNKNVSGKFNCSAWDVRKLGGLLGPPWGRIWVNSTFGVCGSSGEPSGWWGVKRLFAEPCPTQQNWIMFNALNWPNIPHGRLWCFPACLHLKMVLREKKTESDNWHLARPRVLCPCDSSAPWCVPSSPIWKRTTGGHLAQGMSTVVCCVYAVCVCCVCCGAVCVSCMLYV